MNRKNVVVVIATYNEADNIAELLFELSDYTVVVVDDNSPDGTGKIAKRFANTYVISRPGKLGIASAYKEGFKYALTLKPDYVVQMDAGFTHNPSDVKRLVDTCSLGFGLVIGSRFMHNFDYKGYRTLLSKMASLLMNLIGLNVTDATSGFRCWRPDLLAIIVNKVWLSHGFAFQLETLKAANSTPKIGTICSIPIDYKLTNSSLTYKMVLEALWIYSILFLS